MLTNKNFDTDIGYHIFIGRDLMLKLGPIAYFNHNLLKWDENVVLMKEPGNFLGKPYLSKKDMQEVQINTVYPGVH